MTMSARPLPPIPAAELPADIVAVTVVRHGRPYLAYRWRHPTRSQCSVSRRFIESLRRLDAIDRLFLGKHFDPTLTSAPHEYRS